MSPASSLREPHHPLGPHPDLHHDQHPDVLAHRGRTVPTLPGPLPAGDLEPEPGGGVTEQPR